VTRVLIAALVALILSILIGPRFIAFLRKNEFGQHIREDGPEHHLAKSGTPTMGGLMILLSATVAFLATTHFTLQGLTVLFTTLACGAIGFLDDFIKLTHRRSLGLAGRWKMLLLVLIAVIVSIVAEHLQIQHSVFLPIFNVNIPLSYAWYVFIFLVIAGTANATNLADGVDGLAAGTGIIAIFTFTAINVVSFVRSGAVPAHRNITDLDLAIVGAALVGAAIGFLWYNAHPAEIFMGDVGSLALGGALATVAILIKQELLLVIVGGVFVIEAASVVLQVASFKLRGKRIFKMAPIHHHFELSGWEEPKVITRFLIVAIIFALLSLTTLKLR
jgi:phospho-N-acetylmuramoyl-pentapeptide-transferase